MAPALRPALKTPLNFDQKINGLSNMNDIEVLPGWGYRSSPSLFPFSLLFFTVKAAGAVVMCALVSAVR